MLCFLRWLRDRAILAGFRWFWLQWFHLNTSWPLALWRIAQRNGLKSFLFQLKDAKAPKKMLVMPWSWLASQALSASGKLASRKGNLDGTSVVDSGSTNLWESSWIGETVKKTAYRSQYCFFKHIFKDCVFDRSFVANIILSYPKPRHSQI